MFVFRLALGAFDDGPGLDSPANFNLSQTGTGRLIAWFAAIFLVMGGFQCWRLAQADVASWLTVDYSMRLVVLILLAVIPTTRSIVYGSGGQRRSLNEIWLWIGVAALTTYLLNQINELLWLAVPDTELGYYPLPRGALRLIDLTFGIALVALQEELFFRRLARATFSWLGDGWTMIAITSIVFGLYHWWSGIPNVATTTGFGVMLMLLYRRTGVLWPSVLVHYGIDFYAFY